MKILSSTQPLIFGCLSNNTPPKPSLNTENDLINKSKQPKIKKKQALSVAEVERVIGAGVFRDRDLTNRNVEEKKTLFDSILSNSIGKSEGKMERKLRESGEWIVDKTENASSSAGKSILLFVFWVILPMWILSYFVASGIIKLPFYSPYLEDLIM